MFKQNTFSSLLKNIKFLPALIIISVFPFSFALAAETEDETVPPTLLKDVNGDGLVSIAAFGDSITRGIGDFTPVGARVTDNATRPSGEAGYPLRIENKLHISVSNLGWPGEYAVPNGLYRFAATIPSKNVDIVIMAEGTNDALLMTNPGEYYHNMQAMINIARASGKTPVIATLTPTTQVHRYQEPWILAYDKTVRELASCNEISLADVLHAYENTCRINDCYLLNLPEGLHPNTAGYDVMSEVIMAALLQIPLFSPEGPAQLEAALGLPAGSVRTKPDPLPPAPAPAS